MKLGKNPASQKVMQIRSVLIFVVIFLAIIIGVLIYFLIARPWEDTDDDALRRKACSNNYAGFCTTNWGLQCVPKNLLTEQLSEDNVSKLRGNPSIYNFVQGASGGTAVWESEAIDGEPQAFFVVDKDKMSIIQIFEAFRFWKDTQLEQGPTLAIVYEAGGITNVCILVTLKNGTKSIVSNYEDTEEVEGIRYIMAVETPEQMINNLKYTKEFKCPTDDGDGGSESTLANTLIMDKDDFISYVKTVMD